MKIIAQIAGGTFLAEVTETEVANMVGIDSTYGEEWKSLISRCGGNYHQPRLQVGMTFQANQISEWHRNLQYKQKQAKENAGLLRSLADMIEHACPETFLMPPTETEIEAAAADAREADDDKPHV